MARATGPSRVLTEAISLAENGCDIATAVSAALTHLCVAGRTTADTWELVNESAKSLGYATGYPEADADGKGVFCLQFALRLLRPVLDMHSPALQPDPGLWNRQPGNKRTSEAQ